MESVVSVGELPLVDEQSGVDFTLFTAASIASKGIATGMKSGW